MGSLGVRIAQVFLILIFSNHSFAETLIYSDFDDSIVESRPEYDGQYLAHYILFRNEYRANTLQDVAQGPKQIRISTRDFREIRDLLSKGRHIPGSLAPYTLSDGQVIIPGEYEIRFDDSFEEFRPSRNGQSFLLQQLLTTQTAASSQKKWQGLFYRAMKKILSTEEGARAFRILTSRGHEASEWEEFFKELKSQGEIRFLPNANAFHNIARREYDSITVAFDDIALKIGLLERAARALNDRPLTEADERLAENGETFERLHVLVFVDDDPKIIQAAYEKFKELAMSRRFPVKYVLINTGTEEEVQRSGRPRAIVLREHGGWRLAAPQEVTGEVLKKAKVKDVPARPAQTCRDALKLVF